MSLRNHKLLFYNQEYEVQAAYFLINYISLESKLVNISLNFLLTLNYISRNIKALYIMIKHNLCYIIDSYTKISKVYFTEVDN